MHVTWEVHQYINDKRLQNREHTDSAKNVDSKPRVLHRRIGLNIVPRNRQLKNVTEIRHCVVRHDDDVGCFEEINSED